MERSPVAVVIVTYQSEQVIAGCLESLPDGIRTIVVDNASTDSTVSVAAATRPGVQIVLNPVNAGFAAGVNLGIKAAEGYDVLVLNADIRLHPGAVETLRATGKPIVAPRIVGEDGALHHSLRRAPKVIGALADAAIGGGRAGRIGLGETITDAKDYEHAHRVDWATGCAWLISRETIEKYGHLDERYFLYSEETEYMLRAGGVWFEPRATATHIGGEVSTNPRLWSMLTANRVRLHRERHGRIAAFLMWLAVVLNEGIRATSPKHRAALKELFGMSRWPAETTPQEGPAYLCFSAQDWWYHNRAHSDFQLLRRVAKHRKVLLVNSIGLRMPSPGKSTQFLRRILRKAKSVAMLVRRPIEDTPNFYVMTPGSPAVLRQAVAAQAELRAGAHPGPRRLLLPADGHTGRGRYHPHRVGRRGTHAPQEPGLQPLGPALRVPRGRPGHHRRTGEQAAVQFGLRALREPRSPGRGAGADRHPRALPRPRRGRRPLHPHAPSCPRTSRRSPARASGSSAASTTTWSTST